MRRIKWLSGLMLMLFCLLLPVREAQGQATVRQFYVVCSSAANQPTVYFSGILQGPATAVQSFRAAYLQFLTKSFSYQSGVACAPTNSAANAQTFMTNQANALRSAKKNVVLTEWTEPAPDASGAAKTSTNATPPLVSVLGHKTNTPSAAPATPAPKASAAQASSPQAPAASAPASAKTAGANSGGNSSGTSALDVLDRIFGTGSNGGSGGRSGVPDPAAAGGASTTKTARGAGASKSASAGAGNGANAGGGYLGAATQTASDLANIFGHKDSSKASGGGGAGSKPGNQVANNAPGVGGAVGGQTAPGAASLRSTPGSSSLPNGALGSATLADTKLVVYGCGRQALQVACVADLTNQNAQETLVQSANVWKDAFIVDDRGDRHVRTNGFFLNIDSEQRQQLDISNGKSARFVLMFDGVPAKVQSVTLRSETGGLNIADIPLIAR